MYEVLILQDQFTISGLVLILITASKTAFDIIKLLDASGRPKNRLDDNKIDLQFYNLFSKQLWEAQASETRDRKKAIEDFGACFELFHPSVGQLRREPHEIKLTISYTNSGTKDA